MQIAMLFAGEAILTSDDGPDLLIGQPASFESFIGIEPSQQLMDFNFAGLSVHQCRQRFF